MKHAALLRGINVGGKNKLAKEDLVAVFEQAGCTDVVTYIQSGNVVFTASSALAGTLPTTVAATLLKKHKLSVPVVVRSHTELAATWKKNPFLARGDDEAQLHVAFLSATPGAERARLLDASRSPGDELALVGKDLYLRLPNGVGKSKLTNAYFDATLKVTSTLRNLATVRKLVELSAAG